MRSQCLACAALDKRMAACKPACDELESKKQSSGHSLQALPWGQVNRTRASSHQARACVPGGAPTCPQARTLLLCFGSGKVAVSV